MISLFVFVWQQENQHVMWGFQTQDNVNWDCLNAGGALYKLVIKIEGREEANGTKVGIVRFFKKKRYQQAVRLLTRCLRINLIPFACNDRHLIYFPKKDGYVSSPHYDRILGGKAQAPISFEAKKKSEQPGKVKPMVEKREDAPVFQRAKQQNAQLPPPPAALDTSVGGVAPPAEQKQLLVTQQLSVPPCPEPVEPKQPVVTTTSQQPLCLVSPSVVNARPSVGAGGSVADAVEEAKPARLSAAGWAQRMKKKYLDAGMCLCLLFYD